MARNATPEVFTKAFANNPHIVWFQHRIMMIGTILGGGTDEIVLFVHTFPVSLPAWPVRCSVLVRTRSRRWLDPRRFGGV
jgi:hypothetical protein